MLCKVGGCLQLSNTVIVIYLDKKVGYGLREDYSENSDFGEICVEL